MTDAAPLGVLVLADTHLRRDWPNRALPTRVRDLLAHADVVLHAGAVRDARVLVVDD
jgi:predicted phosphodiesterase